MNQELWSEVDDYFAERFLPRDEILAAVQGSSAEAGLPPIAVTSLQGRLLYLLAKLAGARRILEIGTLAGYSTIWLARALPAGGSLLSLEVEAKHAEIAGKNLRDAGVSGQVEIRVGRALDLLAALREDRSARFDFVFIDADKPNTGEYFRRVIDLCLPGAVIVVDNVVRQGRLIDRETTDLGAVGMRRFVDIASTDRRIEATGIQTVGAKGYDGFVLLRVRT
jgi:predicted O-methyltransferase YrrM